ncbi:MAG: hypothetical protein ABL993_16015 [Vicinamibacterales bacterium]
MPRSAWLIVASGEPSLAPSNPFMILAGRTPLHATGIGFDPSHP